MEIQIKNKLMDMLDKKDFNYHTYISLEEYHGIRNKFYEKFTPPLKRMFIRFPSGFVRRPSYPYKPDMSKIGDMYAGFEQYISYKDSGRAKYIWV